ncbi:uridine kinase [Deinococcus peraridilitoris]|nr:uridine kinase [Deinococcus peraridilitoris]
MTDLHFPSAGTAKEPFVIGVAGGSGSGKTTVTLRVVSTVGAAGAAVLNQDNYYRDQSDIPFDARLGTNYDHPAAFDWELLLAHLDALTSGVPIEMPTYDFTQHTRAARTQTVLPAPVVVLEGFFALYDARLRDRMHLKVFVDADADVRFIRRFLRDTSERGRTPDSVIQQYLDYVRPMHLQFVEPTKRYADVIIPHGGMNEPALDMLTARIRATLPGTA